MSFLLENTVLAALAAALVLAVCRWFRPSPALAHALWVLVLLKLLCPPVVRLALPFHAADLWPSTSSATVTPPIAARIAPPAVAHVAPPAAAHRAPAPIALPDAPPARRAATKAPDAAPPQVTATALLAWLWFTGSAVMLAVIAAGLARVRRLTRAARPAPDWLRAETDRLAATLGIRAPRVRVSAAIDSAFVWTLWRPTLLWPAAHLRRDEVDRVRSILAHELAHLRRRDHWTAWLETAATVALWWHPLMWWVRRRLRAQAELACDAWAVWAVPHARRAYAGALIDALRHEPPAATATPVLGARPSARRAFEKRLKMILNEDIPRRLSRWALLPIAALTFTVLAGFGQAQERGERRTGRDTEKRVQRDVLRAVNEQLRERLGEEFQVESLDDLDAKIREYVREKTRAAERRAEPRREERPRRTKRAARDDTGIDVKAMLREGLEEARREIRNDKDLREMGLTGDVEELVEGLIDGKGNLSDALPGLIRKAMQFGLKEARTEIRKDEDLRRLGLTGDVEKMVEGLLGGGDLGKGLEGVIHKAMEQGLKEARVEIRNDEDLRRLGLTGDVEKLLDGLMGKGDFAGGLEALIGKALEHGLKDVRVDVRGDVEKVIERAMQDVRKVKDLPRDLEERILRKTRGGARKEEADEDFETRIERMIRDVRKKAEARTKRDRLAPRKTGKRII